MAIALTEVLLAEGGIHFRRHPEVFPNLYLPYLNLQLPGLDMDKITHLFADLDCSGINMEYANLTALSLNNGKMRNAQLSKARLVGAELNDANLHRAKFNRANLFRIKLNGANLIGAEFNQTFMIAAELSQANLNSASINDSDLSNADLNGASFYLAKISNIEFNRNTSLRGALFDTENIKEIRKHLDAFSLTWVINAPKLEDVVRYKSFRFERDRHNFIHKLPNVLTLEELKGLNSLWAVSFGSNSDSIILK